MSKYLNKTYSDILVHFKLQNLEDLDKPMIIYAFFIEGDEGIYWYVGQSYYGLRRRICSHCSDCWKRKDNSKKANVMRKYKELTAQILCVCKDVYEMDQKEREHIEECYQKYGRWCLNTLLKVTPTRERISIKDVDDKYKIHRYTLQGEYIDTFLSIRDAARQTGACRNLISRVVNHRANTAGGYQWRFASDNTPVTAVLPHCTTIIVAETNNVKQTEKYQKEFFKTSKLKHEIQSKTRVPPMYRKSRRMETREDKKLREQKARGHKILQYDLNGTFLKEYPSMREAERQTRINVKAIENCCNGLYKQSGGFQFRKKGDGSLPILTNLIPKSEETRQLNVESKGIKVAQYTPDMVLVKIYPSIHQAELQNNLHGLRNNIDKHQLRNNYYWVLQ